MVSAPATLRWNASILLATQDHPPAPDANELTETLFRIEIYSEEWGLFFSDRGRSSWIRVTDIPFVHGRDDMRLLAAMPALKDIGGFLRQLEKQHGVRFRREHALVRTNLPDAELAIRRWALTLG